MKSSAAPITLTADRESLASIRDTVNGAGRPSSWGGRPRYFQGARAMKMRELMGPEAVERAVALGAPRESLEREEGDWFSAIELAAMQLDGLPGDPAAIDRMALAQGWKKRRRGKK